MDNALKKFSSPSFWQSLLIIPRSSRNEGRNGRKEKVLDEKNFQRAEANSYKISTSF